MKSILFFFSALLSYFAYAQIPTYYNNVNLTLTGLALKSELSNKIIVTHTNELDYSNVWSVLQQTDLDPSNSNNVLLLYGFNDGDGDPTTDRTRNKNNNGGNVGEWNREHTFAQSLATPNMTTSSPNAGTDAHHLRASDVQMNGNRGNRLFASGSGNAGNVGVNWYPGDEWKGDVARMMMYMYLRYPSQCTPDDVGVGSSVAIDPAMISLFLDWNADDTVSIYETNRNNILEGVQGNRNPFIDNPYLATIIWGGTVAQDKWNMTTSISQRNNEDFLSIYPNPAVNEATITVRLKEKSTIVIYGIKGELLNTYSNVSSQVINDLKSGLYIFKITNDDKVITQKVVVN